MAEKISRTTVNEAEEVDLELKRLQIIELREQIQSREERRDRLKQSREKASIDFKKSQEEQTYRQRICKHRKGGRDNRFASGSDANHSIITNVYPTGEICILCTRCGKEVWRPKYSLKKENPKLYEEQMAEFRKWADMPTDNTPSGSKIFEINAA